MDLILFLNKCIQTIISSSINVLAKSDKSVQTDLHKYRFAIISKEIFPVKHDAMIEYIENVYGNLCAIAFVFGWCTCDTNTNMISNLDRLGKHLGMILKLAMDCDSIHADIETYQNTGVTMNYVINFGLDDTFRQFCESKNMLIEGLMVLNLYIGTISEMIKLLESSIDVIVNASSPDIHRTSSATS